MNVMTKEQALAHITFSELKMPIRRMSDVARCLDIPRRHIYRYFQNISDLNKEIANFSVCRFIQDLNYEINVDFDAFSCFLDFCHDVVRIELSGVLDSSSKGTLEKYQEFRSTALRRIIEKGRHSQTFSFDDLDVAVSFGFHVLDGYIRQVSAALARAHGTAGSRLAGSFRLLDCNELEALPEVCEMLMRAFGFVLAEEQERDRLKALNKAC